MKPESKNNRLRVYIPLAIVIIVVLAGAWYWYKDYSQYITTDDAHIDADNVSIGSKILGRISSIYGIEGDLVKQGTLLADIDSSDLHAQKNQFVALKAQALANFAQSEAKYSSDQKSIRVLEIKLERADEDMTRSKSQSDGGVITPEQFDHIKKAYETASAQLDAAKAQLMVSKSMISSASAAVETADAQVKVLDTQLKNTRLYAPADGILAKRWLLPGDVVQPGQSVFTLTMSKNLWVVAFLEETKISNVHTGQSVKFTIDAIPGVKFNGKVFLVGSTTASVFSLIPANNASGNFTKVTQRIPVRISIVSADNNKEIPSFNIFSGMSVVVKIIKN
ncbi:MAG: HlyD family secretion protein [Bacteroidia bacterium]|nr:HlyD family secretion protein [Bacteroidia bacterium]